MSRSGSGRRIEQPDQFRREAFTETCLAPLDPHHDVHEHPRQILPQSRVVSVRRAQRDRVGSQARERGQARAAGGGEHATYLLRVEDSLGGGVGDVGFKTGCQGRGGL